MATLSNSPEYDIVYIHDLCVNMYAGIYEFEKQKKQRVIINLEIEVETNKNKDIKNIDDILSYEIICNEITSVCQSKHYDLIEELAEDISVLCLQKKQAKSVTLIVNKPDIIENTKTVGVKIKRNKS